MYYVTVNEGGPFSPSSENATYRTEQVDVTVTYLNAEAEERQLPLESIRSVKFVPKNGQHPGLLHEVPYERLVSIASDEES